MTVVFSPAPKPISAPRPPKGLRKENKTRAKNEFERCYLSRARQKFVNLRACSACHVWGYSENAHVLGDGAAGMKGPYTSIAPLCSVRPDGNTIYEGCHRFSHRDPSAFRARFPDFNPRKAARETQRAWKRFLAGESVGLPSTEHE